MESQTLQFYSKTFCHYFASGRELKGLIYDHLGSTGCSKIVKQTIFLFREASIVGQVVELQKRIGIYVCQVKNTITGVGKVRRENAHGIAERCQFALFPPLVITFSLKLEDIVY